MKVERILFPTDFSKGAQHALHCAVDLAEHYKSKLYILHVVYDMTQAVGVHVPHISTDEVFKEMNDWAILKFASDEKIDMIVMGTYGRVGLNRLIFGNTAERVVRRAPCPVMTVKEPEHRG